MGTIHTEIFGRLLGIGFTKQLVSNDIDITPPCVDCTITVAAESPANTIGITIQLKDADGNDINYAEVVELMIFGDANRLSGADGGSTGLAISGDGALIATTEAKKHLIVSSEADGDIGLSFVDTGTTAYYLGVKLPTGRIVMSSVIQMAP